MIGWEGTTTAGAAEDEQEEEEQEEEETARRRRFVGLASRRACSMFLVSTVKHKNGVSGSTGDPPPECRLNAEITTPNENTCSSELSCLPR